MSGIEYWIWFAQRQKLKYSTRRRLIEHFGGAKEIYFASGRDFSCIDGLLDSEARDLEDKELGDTGRVISRCEQENVGIICYGDAIYPERLRAIPEPPYVLYIKGRLPSVDIEPVIGMVGTRKSTVYGDKMARNIAYEVASKGGIVATGLAEGIDSRCAEGALLAGGRVIGVLGCAIDQVYPRFNRRLYDDVAAVGALLSEYPPGTPGSRTYFPRRNRIIAGLSVGVTIVEAPLKSGALITANFALDYGRDVFAVPGNVDAVNSKGCNRLLREGAYICENGWDVLKEYEQRFPDKIQSRARGDMPEELAVPEPPEKAEQKTGKSFFKFRVPLKRKKSEKTPAAEEELASQLEKLSESQLKIVGAIEKPSTHIDDIIDKSCLPAQTVLSELTILQLKGFVSQEAGKRFTLNIKK